MKWYFWVIIGLVILLIIAYFYKQNQNKNKSTNYGPVGVATLDPKVWIQSLINDGKSFEEIKSIAANSNPKILVLDSNETHTMEFNPNRVIIKVTAVQCLVAPCPQQLEIISVG